MMLELLMTRQSDLDKAVIENCRGLKFIVLDELHTYRGRQGADVAMLMRRLRARVGDPNRPPICIGTSATMASEGIEDDRNQIVAGVASRLFGTVIARDAIVTETLKRATNPERSADEGLTELGTSVRRAADETPYDGKSNEEIALDAPAIWVETRLGLKEFNRKPLRASLKSLKEAAALLHDECRENLSICEAALKNCLLAFSLSEGARGVAGGSDEPLFAFKLHQFISGAGRLYATLDHAGSRSVTFDGQVFDLTHPDKRLFATHFCRRCGQEHHPVNALEEMGAARFEKREIDDVPINDDDDTDGAASRWGFLMPEPVDGEFLFQGRDEDYPDPWLEEGRSGELRLRAHVMAAERLHGDDTTVPVLARGKTDVARAWIYVRDDRPFGGAAPPAAVFYYSHDRGGEHPQAHLAGYTGILQADAYGGYGKLYAAGRSPGMILEAGCWSHARRKFFVLADVEGATGRKTRGKQPAAISPLCLEAVQRIDKLFDIERDINGCSADRRRTVRQECSAPLVADLQAWMREQRAKLSGNNDVARAMDYMLKRWAVFARFLDDGRVCLTNNAAERGLRGIALGRKSWLFAGSDRGGQRAAVMYSLIVSAKMNDIDPQAWLAHVLANIAQHPASRIDELLPWNFQQQAVKLAA